MDAQGFCLFLKKKLEDATGPVESNILNLVSQDLDKNVSLLYRLAGQRDMLRNLIAQIEPFLQDYCKATTGDIL
jgi:hypothetical protein